MPIATRKPAPTPVTDSVTLPPKLPGLPDDVLRRFPSLAQWEEDEQSWWSRTQAALQNNNRTVSQTITKNGVDVRNVTVAFGIFKVEIEDEIEIIVNEQEAIGRRIITVSAMAGVNQNIDIQGTPPGAPAPGDFWVDNSDLATPITYEWDGAQWVEVEEPISVAGVADERTARVTADGFLSGKYTLTVIAGNVVTGMNITSSTGSGTDVSSVIFRATDFQIYNGVVGKTMFSVSGTDVNLAGVLTVSTSGKVFTGTGTYANNNTPFYVDSSSNFSLGASLTWNGTTLTIVGSISATTGTIGGFSIGSDYIRDTANSFGMASTITGGNDVRFWAGNTFANRATAPLRFYEDGTGVIAGFTINTNGFSVGSGATQAVLDSSASPYLLFGVIAGGAANLFSLTGSSLVNTSGNVVYDLGWTGAPGYGLLRLYNDGSVKITLDANNGDINAAGELRGETLRFGSFTGAAGEVFAGTMNVTDDGGAPRKVAVFA